MKKNDCEIIRDLLPLYSDGVCSESSRRLVEEHCAGCGECNKMLASMTAALPDAEKAGKAQNPLKKTKRHYLRLALLTAVMAVPFAVAVFVLGSITVNEYYRSGEYSWSSIAATNEMTHFASLLKKGKYEQALSCVGFTGLDGVNRKNEGELMETYKKIFSDFFSEYPISSFECRAGYYVTKMQGELNIYLDEKYTEEVPFGVFISFERDDSGNCWINSVMLNCYDSSQEYRDKEDFISEIYEKFPPNVTAYPGDSIRREMETAFKDGGFVGWNMPTVFTEKFKELYNEQWTCGDKYADENGFVDRESEAYIAEEKEIADRFEEYRKYYSEEIRRLFSEDYRLISVDGEEPHFCNEVYLDGSVFAEGKGCFKQKFTLNMETKDGEKFTAEFFSRVKFNADVPQDISFSDNAPEEFKESFVKLFTEKF